VGRAGKKLNEIIEAMGIQREDIYILNTIKCRPPGNRNPSPEEQANCSGFLQRQLEIIKPDYIVCLGAIAARSFLKVTTPIGELRGEFHIQGKIKVLCTYHPAYILRNPSKKRDVWEDIKFLMKDMGLKIPKKYL
jgi:DNA polymerase